MPNTMNNEQLLAEVEDLFRTMPAMETLGHATGENFAWLGRFAAFVAAWSIPQDMGSGMTIDLLRIEGTEKLPGVFP